MARKPALTEDDVPELTDDELAEMRPAREVMTADEFAAVSSVRARRQTDDPKVSVTIRLNRSVVEAYKGTGKGWQDRMSTALARSANSGAGVAGETRMPSSEARPPKKSA